MQGIKNGVAIGNNMTEGAIMKQIFVFASPIIAASLIQQLYSVVDLIVIGRYGGSQGTVGVSLGGEVADMVTMIALAFSMAGQVQIAQLMGAEKYERLQKAMGTLFTFMMAMRESLF